MVKVRRVISVARAWLLFTRKGVRFSGRPALLGAGLRLRIRGGRRITVGKAFVTMGRQFPAQLATGSVGRITIGDNVFLNQGVFIFAAESVTLGDNVRLADLATVFDLNFHEVSPGSGRGVAPVVIEDNVWIGRNALILPGVTIGRHAVVAAGAVVRNDVPSRSVVAGNPARTVSTFECADEWVRK